MNVIWLPAALDDLDTILASRSRYSDSSAHRLLLAVESRVSALKDFPYLGRTIPEFGDERLRELLESGYRLWYHVYTDRVEIFAIAHSRQDFSEFGGQEYL